MEVRGRILDWQNRRFFSGRVVVCDGLVEAIEECDVDETQIIMPGFVDSHVHIESSMLTPSAFSRLAVRCGTVAVVADPHEIANVLGVAGVQLMLDDAKWSPLDFYFGAPSCVPATELEPSGANLGLDDVWSLLMRDDVFLLSEMMNFPGVIGADKEVMGKINAAHALGKPVDGHAPGLTGSYLAKYCSAGITADHESFSLVEALEKISLGMMVQMREGSAAKNFEALWPLLNSHASKVMFCTDDCHPDELLRLGHIDKIVRMALSKDVSIFDVVLAASVNPVVHYHLPTGLLRVGDKADFIVVDGLEQLTVLETYISGEKVFHDGDVLFSWSPPVVVNNFKALPISMNDIAVSLPYDAESVNVIEVKDGELVTTRQTIPVDEWSTFMERDVLKLAVYDRYRPSVPSVGFVTGFGLKRGAIASSVAHDSHHIIAVGVSDESIVEAINAVVSEKGGIVAVDADGQLKLALPIAGIISDKEGELVANMYEQLDATAKAMGTTLKSPFMTLSFMSLLVIPEIKLGAKGLFDVGKFEYISLFNQRKS